MTHNWKILDLESITSTGLVTKITYGCFTEHQSTELRQIDEIYLDGSPDAPEFIQYEELTEELVLSWVDTLVNKSLIETNLSSSINEIESQFSSSIKVSSGVPWSE
jgi:hypothetical protein|tara:strand:+ start:50 stop:367 length:318 start_codon:yes stop_codon:yes gene_type:complete